MKYILLASAFPRLAGRMSLLNWQRPSSTRRETDPIRCTTYCVMEVSTLAFPGTEHILYLQASFSAPE